MLQSRREFNQWAAALAAGAAFPSVHAQGDTWPSRPVRVIIPFAPGGGTDIVTRVVASKLQTILGKPFVVENKAGANGTLGLDICAKAPPDGYTLSAITASASVNVTLQGNKQPFDLLKDLQPVTQMTTQPYALVVNPKLPVKNVAELLALARSKPGELNFGSSGLGGLSHLSGELLCSMAKVKITHVPYKGGNPALADVVSGQIHMLFSTLFQALPFITAGRLKVLAVSSAHRSPSAPDIPTVAESGVPGYEVSGWYGLMAPQGVPASIVDRLQHEVAQILKQPDVKEKLAVDGSDGVGNTPAQFGAHLRAEVAKWRTLITQNGITGA